MRAAVYGTGAIGAIVGAGIASTGNDVVLVDRVDEHVKMMNTNGLRIVYGDDEQVVPVTASLPGEMSGTYDVVFLAVKSQHTREALDLIEPHLGAESAVVSLQNGLNEPDIADRIGTHRTVGAMVAMAADYHGPGHIVRGTRGKIFVGELDGADTERIRAIRDLVSASTVAIQSSNILGVVWSKLVRGDLDVTTALVDADIAEVLRCKSYQRAYVELLREAVLTARASGVELESYDSFEPELFLDPSAKGVAKACASIDSMAEIAAKSYKVRTGYWRDIVVRKRPTEVPFTTGKIVEIANRFDIPVPVNARQLQMIREIEDGERPMGWANLDELLTLVPR